MGKEMKMTAREIVNRSQEISDRLNELASTLESEQREATEQERRETERLEREMFNIQLRTTALATSYREQHPDAMAEAENVIRENVKMGRKTEIVFLRDVMMVGDVAQGGLVPLNVQEIIRPLSEGFLLDKVGLPMPTGLVGEFVWPMFEMVEAELAGEGVELSDKKIPFSKMTASPERIGIAVPATRQSLNQSAGVLESIIKEVMPRSIRELLNKILLGTEKVNASTNLAGPFVGLTPVELSAVPTFKELNTLKAKLLETGIDGDTLCFTMTKSMEAILEGTPINEKGVFIPMVQNHTLCGIPVYTSNKMRSEDGTEYIGLGDWRYQPMGLFNTLRFVIDPYSKARKDSVDFVLNCDYATKTLRPEAFALASVAKG